jgi:RNA polymerase-binding protein
MTTKRHVLSGRTPWPSAGSPDDPRESPAPRQYAPYTCTRGHQFTVTFAAEAIAPAAWACRCGAAAGLICSGDMPTQHDRRMGQLLGRRSRAELEELLAGRLAQIHEQEARP